MVDEELSGEYDKRLNSQEEENAKKMKKKKKKRHDTQSKHSEESGIRMGNGCDQSEHKKHSESHSKFDNQELQEILEKEMVQEQTQQGHSGNKESNGANQYRGDRRLASLGLPRGRPLAYLLRLGFDTKLIHKTLSFLINFIIIR